VTACCAVTLLAKLHVVAPRRHVNHGDISFYYAVAKNLAAGRGFVIDYIWNFWNRPTGIPTFSNDWWMPLTSVLSALGMLIGGVSYVSAQTTMVVVTSVLPLVVYLLGSELWQSRAVGLVGALLATTFHLFMDQVSAPLSHGPYVVLASLALWLIVRAMRDSRSWKWAGAAIGLAQLARSDSIVLFGALAAAALIGRPRPPWRALLAAPLCWAAVMSPWWIHNLVVLGTPQPGGSLRAAFLPNYLNWYSLPECVTPERWLANGWGAVLALKRQISATNLVTAATGVVSGAADRTGAWEHAPLLVLLWLSWLGLLTTLRRRFIPFWTQWALVWVFYSLVFTAVGEESFRTGMYSVYPMLVLCAAAALLLLARGLSRLLPAGETWRERAAAALVAGASLWLVAGQLRYAEASMIKKGAAIDEMYEAYTALRHQIIEPLGLQDAVLMAMEVHQLNTITGMKGVMIPLEPEPVIREVARRYGATHLLLVNDLIAGDPQNRSLRPGLMDIDKNPHFQLVAGPAERSNKGYRFRLYKIVD
jgi:4-amino-4-deoxy-L-arabinose transferase-like glycosyltransferase